MAVSLKAVDPRGLDKADMLEQLDLLRKRVNKGAVRGLVTVEMGHSFGSAIIHSAGVMPYSEMIGFLEMAKADFCVKAQKEE